MFTAKLVFVACPKLADDKLTNISPLRSKCRNIEALANGFIKPFMW